MIASRCFPDLSFGMLSFLVVEAPSQAVRLCALWCGSCAACSGHASLSPSVVHVLEFAVIYIVEKADSAPSLECRMLDGCAAHCLACKIG